MLAADYAFIAALAFVTGCNLYFAPRITSDRIAMQWGFDGKPTWYAPKALALWGMLAFMLAVRLFIWLVSTHAPQYVHGLQVGIVGFSVTVAAAHFYTLRTAAR